MPFQVHERYISTTDLLLALWLDLDGRITVLNEPEFDAAVASGELDPDESEQAEARIRELTLGMSQKLFPPAMVRRFILKTETSDPVDEP
jgi:predicted RNA-binding protein associated with RNAse of E/G family